METLSDLMQALSDLIPTERAAPWDKVGLQIGDPSAPGRDRGRMSRGQ